MICPNCGATISEETKFCTNCGASLQPEQPQTAAEIPEQPKAPVEIPAEPIPQPVQVKEEARPVSAPVYAEPSVGIKPNFQNMPANLKEFVLHYGDERTQKTMKNTSMALYILGGLNVFIALLSGVFPVDGILLAALGYWYQKDYSNTCAVVLLAYAILSMVMSLLSTGRISGWLILILAVLVFSTTQKAQKAFNDFRKTGQLPMQ